ncbi:hypothetical protein HN018_28175 (plasmid) [Lichenicola cladoniae]|uniref:Uncharacterized protein n=1 Tax=Lichenicola cladoniae TaxID=1484109 RepID=A0A6M8I077_9PROT|nr:hypothetical protein [Lichenicola cladoniae]NPD70347.1 hypothetical protein [Acetobacteraceae bacterium]QKE94002.1 hypothetical protein HN018_28175 [Lichenicola cladoniae]
MISPLANRFFTMAQDDPRPGWKETAALIAQAGRFVLAPEVVKLTLRTPEPDRLMPAVVQGLRLPHDPCWIEYSPHEVFAGRGDAASQFGILLWRDASGEVCNRLITRNRIGSLIRPGDVVPNPEEIAVVLYPCDLVFSPAGAFIRTTRPDLPQQDLAGYQEAAWHLGWMALSFALLLTARNAPLLVGEAEDLERLNRKRARSGKPPLMNARPVHWNLSREERHALRGQVPFDRNARSAAVSHMVRGHMKVRASGAFWWSPHFRNISDAEPIGGRDYVVR